MKTKPRNRAMGPSKDTQAVAGNGLLDRRAFLRGGAAFAAAITSYSMAKSVSAEPLADDPWSKVPGALSPPYEKRSRYEEKVVRTLSNPKGEPRTQHARTPHHLLNGTFTPNGLHFVDLHGGTPDIDPEKHRLVIHGLVKQPLVFTLDALGALSDGVAHDVRRVRRQQRAAFSPRSRCRPTCRRCTAWSLAPSGPASSFPLCSKRPASTRRRNGLSPKARTRRALSRSVPVKKALDDAMIALYQNGERIMPGNGYPMRLLLPGYEGNMNVKFVRRIKLIDQPSMSYYETRNYTQLLPNGRSWQFYFLQEVKSFITHPSPGLALNGPGLYEISGVAYSGNGRIAKVMVSADGGQELGASGAARAGPEQSVYALPHCRGSGTAVPRSCKAAPGTNPATYNRRAPQLVAARGESKGTPPVTAFPGQHYNGITTWAVDAKGEVKNVYA